MKRKNKISGYNLRGTIAALLLSLVTIGLSWAINVTNHTPEASASEHNTAFGVNAHEGATSVEASAIQRNSTLTFADRVAYQRAIEEVYWRHRIWPAQRPDPKPSLDAVMSQAQLEKKVADFLGNSQALQDYWHQPITAEQLQTEMDRMAQHTKQPDVLREIFEALGNDPFIIAECLARPVLAERLVDDSLAQDKTGRFESLRSYELQMPKKVAAIDSIAKAVQVNRPYQLPAIASPSAGCINDTWTATSTTNAPTARTQHTAVWTGSEMIVWGGFHDFPVTRLESGGRYDPITDTWTATSTANAPSARRGHTAVWTGTEMIVWGGDNSSGYLDTGGRYNPSTDSWTATSTTNAPEARVDHTAVWTGNEMIVWGGFNPDAGETNTGGRYNPSTNSWTPTSITNAPSGRNLHTAVWTGSEMIVWGGLADNSGGRYNPVTDNWVSTSTINAPIARAGHTAVWSGSEMIVWGGFPPTGGTYFNTGGKYSPATDSWTPTNTTNAPSARTYHTAVWTGSEMTIWGGGSNTGGRYNPSTDNWTATSTTNAPTARSQHTAVWTDSEMIVWGGVGNGFPFPYFNTGGRYCAPGPPARLGNISTRAFVETGDNVTIGGFIVQGTQPKRVIIRAIGPELTQYGVPDPLANPTLELHDGTGALIASNNNWGTTIIGGIITANQVRDIQASGYAPGDRLESAIITDLRPGNYTAIVRGVNNMTGVGLVEVYDLSPDTASILYNISTRAFVQTGDKVMIGGFIVQGTQPKRVIIRAIGPELGAPPFNVPNALSDPTLELHDASRALIASNDNWQHTIIGGIITADQVSAIQSSGKAPGNASESAIIATLPPGNYTAIVRGVNSTTGVGLVEVYDLNSMLTLDNGTIKVGVDTLYGGGITYLSQSGSTMNLINIYDFGREVQQSYYSGPANFVPPGAVQNPNWSPFPWNPIQVGDSFGYRAAVLAYSNSGGTIYVKTRPMQWALRNYPGDCIFEQWTHLDGPAVRVHCKLTNQRADHTQYPPYGQELPAVYGVGTLCHIFSYTGTAPFTGGALTQIPATSSGMRATENWSALVNSSNFGFGVHHPDAITMGSGYFSSGNPCTGGPTDNNTAYVAPSLAEVLDYNIAYEYDFNLIVGTLTSIRSWVYTHRSDHRPDYHFGTSRQHWWANYGDAGVPSGFLRANLNGPDPSLGGPYTAFAASACPRIYFAARYVMSSPPANPHAELFWETNNDGGFSEARKQSLPVIIDGRWHVYSFDVGSNPAWSGLISQLRLDPIESGGAGDYVDIAGISYQNNF